MADHTLEIRAAGCWNVGNYYGIGAYGNQTNAAGGVDYDRMPFGGPGNPIGRVWATGDAIHLYGSYPDAVYGYQGLRPNINGTTAPISSSVPSQSIRARNPLAICGIFTMIKASAIRPNGTFT